MEKNSDELTQKIEVNLAKLTEDIIKGEPGSKEELKEKIKCLKTELKQNGRLIENGKTVVMKDGPLNNILVKLEEFFGEVSGIGDIEEKLKTTINCIPDKQANKQIKHALLAIRDASVQLREEGSYGTALKILKVIDTEILPRVRKYLSENEERKLKILILQERELVLSRWGKIDSAIKVIDECCELPDYNAKDFIESQIKKSFLLTYKGEFNQAVNILKETLEYECSRQVDKRDLKLAAEIHRSLGIAYRGQGAYKKAVKWFEKAKGEFEKAGDELGIQNTLWGIGIVRHLTGEWEEAIEIWHSLLDFFTRHQDSDLDHKYKEKPFSVLQIKLFVELARTLLFCGRFQEAENTLTKALLNLPELQYRDSDSLEAYIHLFFSELYFYQNKIQEASKAIAKVRQINDERKANKKSTFKELKILSNEIKVLLAQNNADEAKKKLEAQFDSCKSNWDLATYYRLLGLIEKYELNFGLAKKAYESSLEITKESGASSLSDELLYAELLIEMSRTGNRKASQEAKILLTRLEAKVEEKRLLAFILECDLLKAQLACSHSNYDEAYKLLQDVVKKADNFSLFRQKEKAKEAINLIEQEGQQFRAEKTKEMSVFRYLEDARRILEENS
ncbi:MAG: tetratricopeptide repeat protein [Candidatus Heimdallarchaeota archaeon]|nr:MAG: tetratricopeptide repeat protein [Candidatus Heimdallarchaeota archaeon]